MKPAVAVWKVRVETRASELAHCWMQLGPDEQRRAMAFRVEDDRRRFVTARSSRRALLGRFLGVDPTTLIFAANPFGKPALAEHSSVHFNSSHSGDWVVHAISPDCEVGVDVEAFESVPLPLEDYASVLADEELVWLRGLDPLLRPAKFAALWTSKEAYVKALGQGVSRDLRRICIGMEPWGVVQVRHDHNAAKGHSPCALIPVMVGTGYAACLASLGAVPNVVVEDF